MGIKIIKTISLFLLYFLCFESLSGDDLGKYDSLNSVLKSNQFKNDSTITSLYKRLDELGWKSFSTEVADAYYQLGNSYFKYSQNDSALVYFNKALEIGGVVDYNKYFPIVNHMIGNVLWEMSSYYQALEKALLLKKFHENNNTIESNPRLFNLLGMIYYRLKDYPQAYENFLHAADICKKTNNNALLGIVLTNTGSLYNDQEKYRESLEYYEKGVRLEEEYKQFKSAGRSYEALARIFISLNSPDRAASYLLKAQNYNQETNDIVGFTKTYSTYGKLYNYLKDYEKAIEYLKNAESYAVESDLKEYYMNTCEQLIISYQNINDYKNESKYQKKYIELYKQIYNIQDYTKMKGV